MTTRAVQTEVCYDHLKPPRSEMMGRSFLRFSVVFAMAVALAACGRVESYRYKLTLAVKTPQGIKRGSSVAEAKFFDVSIPAKGTMYKLRGQALYLDLGPGARPLVALLTSRIDRKFGWTPEAGPEPRQMAQLKVDVTREIGADVGMFDHG
jgi:hypothetical protein